MPLFLVVKVSFRVHSKKQYYKISSYFCFFFKAHILLVSRDRSTSAAPFMNGSW